MKTNITTILICGLLIFSLEIANAQSDRNALINITISVDSSKLIFDKDEKKFIDILLVNNSNETIFIPEWFCPGFKYNPDADILFEIERWNCKNKAFSRVALVNTIDFHFDPYNRKIEELTPKSKKIITEQLDLLYLINQKGVYRLKVTLLLKSSSSHFELRTDWYKIFVN